MYSYIVLDSGILWEEFLESIFEFSHIIIRGLIKGFSTNKGLCSTLSMRKYCYIVHDGSTPWEEFLKGIFEFSHLLIRGLIKRLCPN